jgi:F420H(2)-dependent quinone reductase
MNIRHRLQVMFTGLHARVWKLTKGRVGGRVAGGPVLILTTTGRTTGKQRESPLLYIDDGSNVVIVASNGGAPDHPAWYKNLKANPAAGVATKSGSREVTARDANQSERERLWPKLDAMYAGYKGYRAKTTREIPLVILEPRR